MIGFDDARPIWSSNRVNRNRCCTCHNGSLGREIGNPGNDSNRLRHWQ